MKTFMMIILTVLSFVSYSQSIATYKAKDSIGKTETVCGGVTGVHTTDKVTFINMGGKYPDNDFTVVGFATDTAKFSYRLSALNGEDICVTGLIKEYKGKPEIIASDGKRIKFQAVKITPRE